eukprot:TRINITY_DN4697_c0_g1_i1.p1 TRINITY_DN4697_c0_g1~~TRINITY_DN4697_c0_g1_i1.p1  ORF type:complete len:369 (+),score=111.76 TRINITY_DN4697_c0_g1_i1:77-1108(+)
MEEVEEAASSAVSWEGHAIEVLGLSHDEQKRVLEFVQGYLSKHAPVKEDEIARDAWTGMVEHVAFMLGEDGLVAELMCTACESVICRRGQRVTLVADGKTQLFSTDLVTKHARQDTNAKTAGLQCACHAADVFCGRCSGKIGYHVLAPCEECSASAHNQHYWLFSPPAVGARLRLETLGAPPAAQGGVEGLDLDGLCDGLLSWRTLPVFEEDNPALLSRVHTKHAEAVDLTHFTCAICMELAFDAASLRCGHSLCEQCAFRQVDRNRCCPVCKASTAGSSPVPNYMARQFLEHTLTFRCRHGCTRDPATGALTPLPHDVGCQEYLRVAELAGHEQHRCRHRPT